MNASSGGRKAAPVILETLRRCQEPHDPEWRCTGFSLSWQCLRTRRSSSLLLYETSWERDIFHYHYPQSESARRCTWVSLGLNRVSGWPSP
ncbi:hypothetical protein JAAARDRAFT_266242 [Jaapia argillacea MUCL 33604]|uniref:Uncharacterized protein n=1 Tax=Jaapia argillacea MUCL 33604 TaxID=933084 RepID=A0A067PRP9_9AGAM|nr:hypothetical protein JAAARDRAFT_266242 [Jaapia argillacea MUCL 33604]